MIIYDLNQLNQQQQNAVKYLAGPLLVIAGAGSGKTKVITSKIAYLINQAKYLPTQIVAVTFTNKAAKEMLTRSSSLLKKHHCESRGLTVSTFHALGLKILRQEAEHVGYKNNFSIIDATDSSKIISDIINSNDKELINQLQRDFSTWKNACTTVDECLRNATSDHEAAKAKLYQTYIQTLHAYQLVDFDDLITLPVQLFKENLAVLYSWQQKIRYLLVDEYQDSNNAQYQLIRALTGKEGNLTVVGDDDQSIYTWRGANVHNLSRLQEDYKNLHVIKLEQNYRSSNTILNAANSLIANNSSAKLFNKKLWSNFAQGVAIKLIAYKNEEEQAKGIARKILAHKMRHHNAKFNDYAILYRSNHHARIMEKALTELNIPYALSGGQSFFAKSEIKDITAYLRLIVNDEDDNAFIRAITTPKRGIGQSSISKLADYAKTRQISLFAAIFEHGFSHSGACTSKQLLHLTQFATFINELSLRAKNAAQIKQMLQDLIDNIHYEQYLYEHENNDKTAKKKFANIIYLINWLGERADIHQHHLADLVQTITLMTILSNNDEEDNADSENDLATDKVRLSTLHAAKGLEYSRVYIINCEEGILPHQQSSNDTILLEEERRLMYVGITRAKDELMISYCKERRQGGDINSPQPSRFLYEIGQHNIDWPDNKNLVNSPITQEEQRLAQQQTIARLNELRELLKSP